MLFGKILVVLKLFCEFFLNKYSKELHLKNTVDHSRVSKWPIHNR